MCTQTATFSFCSCSNGGSYPGDINSTGACKCEDPCEELVQVGDPITDGPSIQGGCPCPIINGSAVGGSLYVTTIKTNFECDPISPPPPDCTTTSSTSVPPPNSSCTNGGGGDPPPE